MSVSSQASQFLTYKLGDEMFAVGVAQVREVLELAPITKVPTAPEYMRGVVIALAEKSGNRDGSDREFQRY